MVEAAKERAAAKGLANVECVQLDMHDLGAVASESCDLVASAHAYPFASDKPKALAEAHRVLRPGGVFGAVVWKSFELLPFAGEMMARVTGKPPSNPPPGIPRSTERVQYTGVISGADSNLCAGHQRRVPYSPPKTVPRGPIGHPP